MSYIEIETISKVRALLSISEIQGVYEVTDGEDKYCVVRTSYFAFWKKKNLV